MALDNTVKRTYYPTEKIAFALVLELGKKMIMMNIPDHVDIILALARVLVYVSG